MSFQYDKARIDDDDIELVVGGHQKRRRSVLRRIIRISLTTAVVLALFNAYVAPISFVTCTRNKAISTATVITDSDMFEGFTEFETGEVIKCWTKDDTTPIEDGEHDVHHAAFPNITLDSDDVYFFARSHADNHHDHYRTTGGSIHFESSDQVDVVTLSSQVKYHYKLYAQLCTYKRENGGLGVGVIVPPHDHEHDPEEPHHPHHAPKRHFRPNTIRLVVTFPTKGDGLLKMKSLETSLPIYSHHIGDIGGTIVFDSLSLQSSNSPIYSESLTANAADVRTSNSPIEGSFNGTNSLKILTVNAPIDVQVAFTTTRSADEDPAELVLNTANAKLSAEITLTAEGDADTGAFKVSTRTANAPLSVRFISAPTGSQLVYDGITRNAPANVDLHSSYEGTFEAQTAWFKAELNARESPEDPSGRGRKRTLTVSNVGRNGFKGDVHWGDKSDETPKGSVVVNTSLAPVSITV